MAQIYFHCANSRRVLIDQNGTTVADLAEAREHAARVVRSLIASHGPEDWRDWILHARDDLDDEIFVMPFAFLLGKPN